MSLRVEWDRRKAASNRKVHGVAFGEAATVFADPLSMTIADPDHSNEEHRFIDLGTSYQGRLLVVSYTERLGRIRIISARVATRRERTQYEETV